MELFFLRRLLWCNTKRGMSSLSISACSRATFPLPPFILPVDVVTVELDREAVVVVVGVTWERPLRRLLTRRVVIFRTAVRTGPDFAATCCSAAMILAAKSASVISSDLLVDIMDLLDVDLSCFTCRVRGVKVE